MTLLAGKLRKALKQISARGRTAYVCVMGSPSGQLKVFHKKDEKKSNILGLSPHKKGVSLQDKVYTCKPMKRSPFIRSLLFFSAKLQL